MVMGPDTPPSSSRWVDLRHGAFDSLVVFLVALPLFMEIGTFVSLPRLATALEGVPPLADLQIQFASLRHLDHACLNLLESWHKLHEATGGQVQQDWNKLHGISYHVRNDRGTPPGGRSGWSNRRPYDTIPRHATARLPAGRLCL